ncbi:MAG: XisI protein [Anaerolineae bacterium]|nr:XisI protein [Anaerolineae bacterium]
MPNKDANLKQILKEEMSLYAKQGLNAYSYLTISTDEHVFAVIDIAIIRGSQIVGAVLVARLMDNQIYIDLDLNDKFLVDALRARGVPDNQLVLNYLLEKVSA